MPNPYDIFGTRPIPQGMRQQPAPLAMPQATNIIEENRLKEEEEEEERRRQEGLSEFEHEPFDLDLGRFRTNLPKLDKNPNFDFDSPLAQAGVRG